MMDQHAEAAMLSEIEKRKTIILSKENTKKAEKPGMRRGAQSSDVCTFRRLDFSEAKLQKK